jgi:heme A synthase
MVHRYVAGLFIFLIVPLVIVAWRRRSELFWAGPAALLIGALYVLQVLLGALNVWYAFPDLLSVSHTVVASCIWTALSATILLTFYAPASERRSARLTTAEVAT